LANQFLNSTAPESGAVLKPKQEKIMAYPKMIYPKGRNRPSCWIVVKSYEQEELVNKRDQCTIAGLDRSTEADEFLKQPLEKNQSEKKMISKTVKKG
jgi:hypothetical protein